MSSQINATGSSIDLVTTPATGAREPKRKRGHIRVAAIMQAGVELFETKGYEATTMTEIATRSGTATASLYRFFPSKEALADALLVQYAQHVINSLGDLRERAAGMTLDDIAEGLVAFRLDLQSQRKFAVELADARGGSANKQQEFRAAILGGLAALILQGVPGATKAKADAMAVVLLHTLKVVTMIGQEKPATRRKLLGEIKTLIRAYLASATKHADSRNPQPLAG